jgi:L-ascorbate metabolism protein UlaG (beta-lactamase superfamily)
MKTGVIVDAFSSGSLLAPEFKKEGFQLIHVRTSKVQIVLAIFVFFYYISKWIMDIQVTPISHATMVLQMGGQIIYTDPVDGIEAFTGQPAPTIILVTDIHPDHMNADTLTVFAKDNPVIVAPQAVMDQLPEDLAKLVVVLKNGEKTTQKGIEIEAVPMYNVPESPNSFHTKGRGNGYVISAGGKRVYISGDTSATSEMKALQNIDVAFMTMNLPYTMDIEEAADAVLAFKPNVVHPYHYRGQNGLSDTTKFKQMIEEKDPSIKVELLNFYPW